MPEKATQSSVTFSERCKAENHLKKRRYPRKEAPHCIWTIVQGFTDLEGEGDFLA